MTQLDRASLQDFYISRAVVTRAEQDSAEPALLAGAPGLFQRLYYSSKLWTVAGIGQMAQVKQQQPPFAFLLPSPVYAVEARANIGDVLGAANSAGA